MSKMSSQNVLVWRISRKVYLLLDIIAGDLGQIVCRTYYFAFVVRFVSLLYFVIRVCHFVVREIRHNLIVSFGDKRDHFCLAN